MVIVFMFTISKETVRNGERARERDRERGREREREEETETEAKGQEMLCLPEDSRLKGNQEKSVCFLNTGSNQPRFREVGDGRRRYGDKQGRGYHRGSGRTALTHASPISARGRRRRV